MAISITVDDVKERYPAITAPDAVIESIIAAVATIYPCLDTSYSQAIGELIAYNLIAHLCTLSQGRSVKSQTAANGSNQSFDTFNAGGGLESTSYGQLVATMDSSGCTSSIVSGSAPFMMSVGGRNTP